MALITAAEARLFLRELSGTGEDTNIDQLIVFADAAIANYLGFPPVSAGGQATIESATYTEYLDGPTLERVSVVQLPLRPVTSITTIHDDPDWAYGAGDLVASTDYTLIGRTGKVALVPTGSHAWSTAYRSIKVVFVAGFTTIPEEIKLATKMLVKHWWGMRHNLTYSSMSSQGSTVTSPTYAAGGAVGMTLPRPVKQLLNPYRLLERNIA